MAPLAPGRGGTLLANMASLASPLHISPDCPHPVALRLSWDIVDAPADAPGTYSPESALVSCVPLPSRSSWPSSGFPTTRGGLLSSSSNRWWRSRRRSCPQTSSPKSLLTLPHSGKRARLPEAGVKADGVLPTSSISLIHVPASTPSVDGVYPVAKQQRLLCLVPAELRATGGSVPARSF